jgi:glutamine amidotransferase
MGGLFLWIRRILSICIFRLSKVRRTTAGGKMNDVILIDAGTGNLRSVQKALESIGVIVERTDDPQKVLSGKRVVLPGVGAFGDFMSGLRARGLEDTVKEIAARGVPLLGICVGMQALFDEGEEMGTHAGLGLLAGKVTRFAESLSVKIPHTGWNQVEVQKEAPLFNGINAGAYVYFNHSYYCQAWNSSDVIATTNYGINYVCTVQRENIFGVQFHPEKSQAVGLLILKNFLEAA